MMTTAKPTLFPFVKQSFKLDPRILVTQKSTIVNATDITAQILRLDTSLFPPFKFPSELIFPSGTPLVSDEDVLFVCADGSITTWELGAETTGQIEVLETSRTKFNVVLAFGKVFIVAGKGNLMRRHENTSP